MRLCCEDGGARNGYFLVSGNLGCFLVMNRKRVLQAVIRRMPRRLLVDLPDITNRAIIAKVRPHPHLFLAAGIEVAGVCCRGGDARLSQYMHVILPRHPLPASHKS